MFESEVWYSSDLNTAYLDRRSLRVFESRFLKSFFFFFYFPRKNRVVVRSVLWQKTNPCFAKIRVIVNSRKVNSCCSKSLFTKKIEEKNRAS